MARGIDGAEEFDGDGERACFAEVDELGRCREALCVVCVSERRAMAFEE